MLHLQPINGTRCAEAVLRFRQGINDLRQRRMGSAAEEVPVIGNRDIAYKL